MGGGFWGLLQWLVPQGREGWLPEFSDWVLGCKTSYHTQESPAPKLPGRLEKFSYWSEPCGIFCLKVNFLGCWTSRPEGPHLSWLTKQVKWSLCLFCYCFVILLFLHVAEFSPRLACFITHHPDARFWARRPTALSSNLWKPGARNKKKYRPRSYHKNGCL